MELTITIIASVSAIITFFLVIMISMKTKKLDEILKQKEKHILSLYKEVEMLSEKKINYHDRVIELENMKGDAFQVKLRNEIINVKIDFTKIEMVTMLAGANVLLERTKNSEDAKIYIGLIEKINGFINDMKE